MNFKKYLQLNIILISILLQLACSSGRGSILLYEAGQRGEQNIVTITVPAAIEILEVDGKKFKHSPGIIDGFYQLEVIEGTHSFKVFYSQVWGSNAFGSMVESGVFHFKFNALAGHRYAFEHNGPKDIFYAEIESDIDVDNINIWLNDDNSKEQIKAAKIDNPGFFPNILGYSSSDTGEIQLVKDKVSANKAEDRTKDEKMKSLVNQTQQKKSDIIQQKAAEQLEFWWKIADAEQRKIFQRWLITLEEVKDSTGNKSMQQNASDQLKFWWKLAELKQRESFLLWIKQKG